MHVCCSAPALSFKMTALKTHKSSFASSSPVCYPPKFYSPSSLNPSLHSSSSATSHSCFPLSLLDLFFSQSSLLCLLSCCMFIYSSSCLFHTSFSVFSFSPFFLLPRLVMFSLTSSMTPCFSSSPCPPVIFLFSHFTFLSVVDLVQCRTIFLFLYSSFFLLSVRFSVFFFLLQNIINYISPSDLFSVTFRIKCFIFSVFVLIFHSFLCSLRSFIFFFCVFLLFLLIIPKTFFPYFLFRCFFYTSFFKPFLLVFPLSTFFSFSCFLLLHFLSFSPPSTSSPPPSLTFRIAFFLLLSLSFSITSLLHSFLPSFLATSSPCFLVSV